MPISPEESLTAWGNANHLRGFLAYYETKIEENSESKKCLTDAPNYFSWIHFASEQVFYRIKEMIYVNTQDEEAFDWPYKRLLDHLILNYSLNNEQREAILLFAKIRHLLVHKGFPNPHVTPSESKREIAKGILFHTSEVNELANSLCNPECYKTLKIKYSIAMNTISSLETAVDQNFGLMLITKKYAK